MALPRFNQITGVVTSETPNHWQRQWLDVSKQIWHDGTHTIIDGVSTGQKSYNVLAAGGGKWYGSAQPRVFSSSGVVIEATGGDPYMDWAGTLIYVRPFNADSREIVKVLPNGDLTVAVPAKLHLNSPRINGELITYRAAGGLYAQYKGAITKVPPINEDVFWPVPFFVQGQPWVLTTTHTGYVLRPINSTLGYRFDNEGKTFNPDVRVDNERIHVVFGLTSGGMNQVKTYAFTEPKYDVRKTVVTPEPPEETMNPPKATIKSYEPKSGSAPLQVKAIWEKSWGSGPVTTVEWLQRNAGSHDWKVVANNSPKDPDHHYSFPEAGEYEIALRVTNPAGSDQTGKQRLVSVRASVPVPPTEPPPTEPPPVEPPTDTTARKGVPRGDRYQFYDGTGNWLPWGTSLFWGLYGFLHEHSRLEEHLDWCKSQGMDFVRVICTGLRKGKTERSVSPDDPNFGKAISGLAELAYFKGLRVQFTIFGAVYDANSAEKRRQTIDKVGTALKGHGEKVWMVEIANEGSANGFPGDSGAKELKELATRLRRYIPNLIATTAVHGMDDIPPDAIKKYYANCVAATCQTLHFSRSTKAPDGIWRPTRKPWREQHFKVEGCCALVQNNEPRGPESSGTETNDARVLAMDAAVSWLCGVGSYLLHTGSGIYGLDDPRGGGTGDDRPNNIWETQNIKEICAGIRNVQRLLPPTLPNFAKHKTNGSTAPFSFKDTPEEQLTGAYSASSGNTIVQLPIGVEKATTFHLKEGRCDGKVYHPITGQVLEQFTQDFHVSPAQPGVVVIAKKG